jgi:adenylate cyclase
MQSQIWIARGYAYQGCVSVRNHVDIAIQHFEQATAVFRRGEPAPPTLHTPDIDITYLVWYALAQLARGQTLHAQQLAAECLAQSRQAGFPALTALHLSVLSVLHSASGPLATASALDAELAQIASAEDLPIWHAASQVLQGWRVAQSGRSTAGLAHIRCGMTAWKGSGMQLFQPFMHLVLARTLAQAGEPEAARDAIIEGIAVAETGPRYLLAELWRARGEILAQSGAVDAGPDAETCAQRAVTIARDQGALLWELRAARSLACLWAARGDQANAYHLLAEVCDRCLEGFDEAELAEARALMAAWAHAQPLGHHIDPPCNRITATSGRVNTRAGGEVCPMPRVT